MEATKLTRDDIGQLLDKMANAIFSALAEADIIIDTNGITTVRVAIEIDNEELLFNLKLMNRVTVSVSPVENDIIAAMGFRK